MSFIFFNNLHSLFNIIVIYEIFYIFINDDHSKLSVIYEHHVLKKFITIIIQNETFN